MTEESNNGSIRKKLSKIKSGAISRGLALAKISVSVGSRAAGHAIGNLFADEADKDSRFKAMLRGQVEMLAKELGELKGSLMKVGQMLSVYGEHVLPPEVNAVLKSLQSQSPALEWAAIQKVLKSELGAEKLALLEIQAEPWAAASLGQVHRGRIKATGQEIALKIQYPGVDRAIESDLRSLRKLLSLTKLIPKGNGPGYDELFAEVREMLVQEVDYRIELSNTQEFFRMLKDDSRYIVPQVFPEFSSQRVLTTSFEEGVPADGPEVLALSQQRRDQLGEAVLELFFRELFIWGKMQTDPHFGNYRVRLGSGPEGSDQLILLDFGAVRVFALKFLRCYRNLVQAGLQGQRSGVVKAGQELGFLREGDSEELLSLFCDVCNLAIEPFQGGPYAWGETDLFARALRKVRDLVLTYRLRPPPREIVFLDRKMSGVFIFVTSLKARFDARPLLEKYLV